MESWRSKERERSNKEQLFSKSVFCGMGKRCPGTGLSAGELPREFSKIRSTRDCLSIGQVLRRIWALPWFNVSQLSPIIGVSHKWIPSNIPFQITIFSFFSILAVAVFQFSKRWLVLGLGADTVCQANPAHSDTRGEASQTDEKETQIGNSKYFFLSVTKIT